MVWERCWGILTPHSIVTVHILIPKKRGSWSGAFSIKALQFRINRAKKSDVGGPDDGPGHLGYTSAATSAGEARPDGLGAMLGHLDPPQHRQLLYTNSEKERVFERYFFVSPASVPDRQSENE